MKRKLKNRVVAAAMSLLMAATLIPTSFVGTTVNVFAEETETVAVPEETTEAVTPEEITVVDYAAENTYKFDATTLTTTADNEAIAEGTTFADDYFKSFGSLKKRWTGSAGNAKCVDTGKAGDGGLTFEVKGKATIKLTISSNGGSNTSAFALVDSDGNAVANNEAATTIYGSSKTTFTYENVEAGVYKVLSPADASNARGVRIYTIEVVDTPLSVTNNYKFDATTLTTTADNEAIAEGTTFADDYFKSFGSLKKRWTGSAGNAKCVDTGKAGDGGLTFEVKGKATIKLTISSNGGSNTSAFALVDSDGNAIANNEAATTIYGSSKTTFTYENVEAGVYKVLSPADASNARGVRIYTIEVSDVITGGQVSGTAPVISTVEAKVADADSSKIIVEWTTTTDATEDGATVIEMSKDGGEFKQIAKIKSTESKKSVEQTVTSSGSYVFKVYGVLGNEKTAEVTSNAVDYALPLAKPVVMAAPADSAISVSWADVEEATRYDLIIYNEYDGTSQTVENATSPYTLSGIENGCPYKFAVVAKRTTPEAVITSDKTDIVRAAAVDTKADLFKADVLPEKKDLADNSVTYTTAAGHTVTVLASSDKKVNIQSATSNKDLFDGTTEGSTKTVSGEKFTKAINLGGKSASEMVPTERAIEFNLNEDGYIELFAAGTGKGEVRKAHLYQVKNGKYELVDDLNVGPYDGAVASAMAELKKGTYRINGAASIAIYGIRFGTGKPPRMNWKYVDAPVITSVTNNNDGTFTVDFTMAMDNDGADSVTVYAYQNGFEVSNKEVVGDNQAIVKAKNDGSYTFKAIAQRTGEPDKESNVFSLEGYQTPFATPYITWLNNLGNGSVYVDWNNVEDATFDVLYKVDGTDDYSVAVTNNTTGNYTITGLAEGTTYAVKVVAHSKSGKGDSVNEKTITVGAPVQQWYAAVFGSATSSTMTIGGEKYSLKSGNDEYADGTPVADITGTDKTVVIDKSNNGKIADSEEGIEVYYTKINPNTENFKVTATFTVTDDYYVNNQSGFGIYAMDIKGVGSKDAKYQNSVAVGQFKMFGGTYHSNGMRTVTGYTTYDPTSTAGSGRVLDNTQKFATQSTDDHSSNGDTFTYTLEKNNKGFTLTMDGDSTVLTADDVKRIMVQEDGSMILALAAARVGVEISNIKFEKTAGGVDKVDTTTLVDPNLNIFSTDKVGTQDYEFICAPNVEGWLIVEANGEKLFDAEIYPDKAVRVPMKLWNEGGFNAFTYEFCINENNKNLSDYGSFKKEVKVLWQTIGTVGEAIYVSPDASQGGAGSKEDPIDLQTALYFAQPGQYIVLKDGTYYPTTDLVIPRSQGSSVTNAKEIAKDAGEGVMTTLMAENPGKVIIDGSKIDTTEKASQANLSLVGSYWRIYGIDFVNAKGVGMRVNGNYNVIEMCNFYNNSNSGLQISRYSGEPNDNMMWPSYNLVKNCTAYDNCDPGRSDADGFAAKLTSGEGNKFYGCISHNNIDDGWDLYAKSTTGSIGAVVIENCVTYSNGWLSKDDPSKMSADDFGEGNGFKMGGENMPGAHQLINSISYNNYAKGVTSNSGPDVGLTNVTLFNNSLSNKSYNVSLYTKTSNEKAWTAKGVLSVVDKTNPTSRGTADCYPDKELGASNGIISSLRSTTNYLYDGSKSLNTQAVEATSAWFVSIDVLGITPTRNADGTINMHGLLELKDTAPSDTGARLVTTGTAVSLAPVPGKPVSYKSFAIGGPIGVVEPAGNTSVKTGDASPIAMLMILMMMSACGCAVMMFRRKRA